MSVTRSKEENKQIYNLCQTIRSFCFVNAAKEYINTEGKSRGSFHIIQRTSIDESEVGLLIKSKNWDTLFSNEEWLVMIEGASNLNIMYQYKPVKEALIGIVKFFPKETESRIHPLSVHSF